jgi:1-acyl-sn-glycerol-3-phosphate acyltransferase
MMKNGQINIRTLIFFLVIVPIMFIGMTIYLFVNLIDTTGDSFHKLGAWWGRLCARIFGIAVEVTGRENYNSDKNYLVLSNHAGMSDIPLILGNIDLNIRFLAKEELGRIPIFGWTLKQAGYVMIKRGQNREALKSLLAATNVLKSGRSVHIFPEGTRSFDGKMLPFKRGAFLVAQKGGAPVLPVTIIGSHLVTPKKSLKINKGKIKIIIGKPIDPSQFKSVEELMQACSNIIGTNLERFSNN